MDLEPNRRRRRSRRTIVCSPQKFFCVHSRSGDDRCAILSRLESLQTLFCWKSCLPSNDLNDQLSLSIVNHDFVVNNEQLAHHEEEPETNISLSVSPFMRYSGQWIDFHFLDSRRVPQSGNKSSIWFSPFLPLSWLFHLLPIVSPFMIRLPSSPSQTSSLPLYLRYKQFWCTPATRKKSIIFPSSSHLFFLFLNTSHHESQTSFIYSNFRSFSLILINTQIKTNLLVWFRPSHLFYTFHLALSPPSNSPASYGSSTITSDVPFAPLYLLPNFLNLFHHFHPYRQDSVHFWLVLRNKSYENSYILFLTEISKTIVERQLISFVLPFSWPENWAANQVFSG